MIINGYTVNTWRNLSYSPRDRETWSYRVDHPKSWDGRSHERQDTFWTRREAMAAARAYIQLHRAVRIAFDWHGGAGSGLYQWASTFGKEGADRALAEARENLAWQQTDGHIRDIRHMRFFISVLEDQTSNSPKV